MKDQQDILQLVIFFHYKVMKFNTISTSFSSTYSLPLSGLRDLPTDVTATAIGCLHTTVPQSHNIEVSH